MKLLKTLGVARRELDHFVDELGLIARDESALEPARGDRRFSDPAWQSHPVYKRLGQAYLALSRSADHLVEDIELSWRNRERARFLKDVVVSAAAPTNTLPGNPAALREAVDTRGRSVARGMKHLWQDLLHNGGSPSTVDSSGFIKGENLACTPGAVVFRNEVLELLQYTPAGTSVYKTPMLLIPPQINKYYFTDLAPGRSLVEYAVSQGLQMFVVSWRNPTAEQSGWTMDTYVGALYEAVDAMLAISRSPKFNSIGFCAGGITQSCLAAHMAAVGDQRLNSIGYAVTLLDWQIPSMMGLLQSDTLLKLAKRRSGHKGLLAGADLNRVFAWFRPNDLVWNYWVNNYLMGRTPPAFDILAWNADGTNLPAGLLLQYLDIFQDNKLAKPGAFEVLGTPIDLGKITVDAYLTGGVTDHLTPWQGCYRSSQLLGSKHKRFILSSSGHIASLVNPPGNPKASYFVGPNPDMDAGEWQSQAQQCQGSWWEDWIVWTGERSGEKKRAPRRLGSARHPELVAAPGTYIYG